MLEIARKKLGEKTDLRLGDSEYLPFDDESFDVVICTDSFHHYPHPKNALTEFRRVLHPKGRIIIADPYAPTPIRQIFNLIMPHTHEGDVKMYSEYNIRKLLENTGFNTIEWEKVGRTAFIVTASN
jgi:ubiquinone/menaquinone biosynthesis C-methylase UbiE